MANSGCPSASKSPMTGGPPRSPVATVSTWSFSSVRTDTLPVSSSTATISARPSKVPGVKVPLTLEPKSATA
jgi:hypothetical protein